MNTLGIVQACHVAPPHDSNVARKLGGKTLLEWVVRRATDCQRLDKVVVLLGDSPAERELGRLVPPDVTLFVSQRPDALARVAEAVEQHAATAIMRICADNPFVDPVLIDRLVSTAAAHAGSDYVSYCSSDGEPTILSPLGPFAEWCSASAIRQADKSAKRDADRQDVTRYIHSHRQKFQIRLLEVPGRLDRSDLRLRIDGQEDWDHIQVIHEALGADEWDWQRLAGLLDQPANAVKRPALLRARQH